MKRVPHDEEHPSTTPVECKSFPILEEGHLFINGLDHLVRTAAPIFHARLTPALRRGDRNCHCVKQPADVFVFHMRLFLCVLNSFRDAMPAPSSSSYHSVPVLESRHPFTYV